MRLFFCVLLIALVGCASTPEEPVTHAHRATLVNDLFQVEQGMPVREPAKTRPFFFKDCEVIGRRPYFTKTEYECSDRP